MAKKLMRVCANTLNLRAEPSATSKKTGSFNRGQLITLADSAMENAVKAVLPFASETGWSYVTSPKMGWVSSKYLIPGAKKCPVKSVTSPSFTAPTGGGMPISPTMAIAGALLIAAGWIAFR